MRFFAFFILLLFIYCTHQPDKIEAIAEGEMVCGHVRTFCVL